jgi:hypothetical protein
MVSAIDRIAGPRGRSRYVADALRERIRQDRLDALRAAAGTWKDNPLFPTDESVVEWVRELRRESTDPGPGA